MPCKMHPITLLEQAQMIHMCTQDSGINMHGTLEHMTWVDSPRHHPALPESLQTPSTHSVQCMQMASRFFTALVRVWLVFPVCTAWIMHGKVCSSAVPITNIPAALPLVELTMMRFQAHIHMGCCVHMSAGVCARECLCQCGYPV